MKWFGRAESTNVEDRRGFGGGRLAMGGVGGLVLLVLSLLFGGDLSQVTGPSQSAHSPQARQAEDTLASFTKVVFRDTEDVWKELFRKMGRDYRLPTLVLYDGYVRSACGTTSNAVGPFYCPNDSRVFIDLSFYRELERKLGAQGDFARAYVIAHEVGHHVQRQLGYRGRGRENSVPLELQADYLAGVWAHHGQEKFHFLEEGDVEEGIRAAYQVGDDTLQKRSQGYVVPDSFTHGSSAQRSYWFKRGFETGEVAGMRGPFEESDLAE